MADRFARCVGMRLMGQRDIADIAAGARHSLEQALRLQRKSTAVVVIRAMGQQQRLLDLVVWAESELES